MKKQLLSLFLLLLFILSIMEPFFNVTASPGDIEATVIDSYEWDAQEGRNPDAVRVNNSEYYLIVFAGETGTEMHGYLRTIQVYDSDRTIKSGAISTYEFCATPILNTGYNSPPKILHIPNSDKYAVAYSDYSTNLLTVSTVKVYDTNGTISASIVDSTQLTQNGTYFDFKQVTGNVYVVGYREPVSADGWIETLWINASGTINNSVLDTQEFDPTIAAFINILTLDADTILIAYQNSSSDGNIYTWGINSAGAIDAAFTDNWEFDTVDNIDVNGLQIIDSNTIAIFYTTTGNAGKIGTINITTAGIITPSWADSLTLDSVKTQCNMFTVDSGSVYGVTYKSSTLNYQNVSTIGISTTGAIDASFIDNLVFDTSTTAGVKHKTIHINGYYYLIVGVGTGADGWAWTVDIETTYQVNAPTMSNPQPANGATGIHVTPSCNVTTHDLNSGTIDVYFYARISDAWVLKQTNASVPANATYRWVYADALSFSQKYDWKVIVTDGTYTNYSAYNFTTELLSACYVSSSTGNDANAGDIGHPWQNISKVNAVLTAGGLPVGGDIYLKRGDVFNDDYLVIKIGGNVADTMVIGAYGTGARPIVNATNYGMLMTTANVNHVRIENISMTNIVFGGIYCYWNHTDIELFNVSLDNIGQNAMYFNQTIGLKIENCTINDTDRGGIVIYGSLLNQISNVTIVNCTISNVGKVTTSDCITIHDGDLSALIDRIGTNFLVKNCICSYATEQAIDLVSHSPGGNVAVVNCTSYANDISGITIGSGIRNVTVINFYSYKENGSSTSMGITPGNSSYVTIRNSIFFNEKYHVIQTATGSENFTFYNNDFILDGISRDDSMIDITSTSKNVIFKNNIIYSMNYSVPSTRILRYFTPGTLTTTLSNWSHNLWWRGDGASTATLWYYNTASNSWSTWLAQTRVWDDMKMSPLLANPASGNFSLNWSATASTSPCIDAGDWLTYTNGAGVASAVVTVDDSRYFYDGYGLINGDYLTIGDDENLMVTEINYYTNQITVNRTFTWGDNEPVSLSYNGSTPDIGAREAIDTNKWIYPGTRYNCNNEYYSTTTGLEFDNVTYSENWMSFNGIGFNVSYAGTKIYVNLSSIASSPKSSTGWIMNWTSQKTSTIPDAHYWINGLKPLHDYIFYGNATTSTKTTKANGSFSINQTQWVRNYKIYDAGIPNTWYVSLTTNVPAGSDVTGTGSIVAPFATIRKAINASTTSDTIIIRGGNYQYPGWGSVGYMRINRSGTKTAPYTITNYTGEEVVIDGQLRSMAANYGMFMLYGVLVADNATCYSNITIHGINFSNCSRAAIRGYSHLTTASNDIIIEDCSFYNISLQAIYMYNEHSDVKYIQNITIRNCSFQRTEEDYVAGETVSLSGCKNFVFSNNTIGYHRGIFFDPGNGGMNGLIEHNVWRMNASGACIKIDGASYGTKNITNVTIRYNLFYGVMSVGTTKSGCVYLMNEIAGGSLFRIYVYNNVINMTLSAVGDYGHGIQIKGVAGATIDEIEIKHNTIYIYDGASSRNIYLNENGGTFKDIVIANNILLNGGTAVNLVYSGDIASTETTVFNRYNNLYDSIDATTWAATFSDGNHTEATCVVANPLCVGVSAGDFHLNITSPAIGAATAVYSVPFDYDGVARPQDITYDIGAYERVGGGSPTGLYVATTGSDSTGSGAIWNPFKTLQKAINTSSTGDTIYIRGGTYNISGMTGNNGIYLNRSGTDSTHHFTITNYTGETVIFNGSRVTYFQAWYAALNIGPFSAAKNITIRGINFSNFDSEYVLRIHNPDTGIKDDIKIQDCSFFNCTNYTIRVSNDFTTTLGFMENLEISNCTFTNITQWSGNPYEGVGISGCKNFKYMYNTMRNCGKNGFAMTDNCMYGYVHDNRFFVNHTITYLDPGSTMMGTDGGLGLNCSHIYIFNNYFWGNNISAIGLDASEHAGGRCENISIYNNVIHTMSWKDGTSSYTHGIMFLQVDATNTSKLKNITISYNTVYVHNGSGSPFFTETVYQGTIRNIIIANNIFVTSRPTGTSYVMKFNEITTAVPSYMLNLQNNLVNRTTGGVSKAYWNGVTGTYYGTDPVNSSPLFVSRWDTQLNVTSPAIGAADVLYTTPYDYAWTARPQAGTYDIGAYERIGGGIVPAAPTATTPGPASNAVDRSSPIPALNITAEDLNADSMDLYFRSNHTGAWVTLDSSLGVFNGTYQSLLPGFILPGKKWWSVNVTDGAYWTNKTFNFTFAAVSDPIGVTLNKVRANWTTSSSVYILWTKGTSTTNTKVYRSNVGYMMGAVEIYSGTNNYYNDTLLNPISRYYYTLRPYSSVSGLYGSYHNVSLAETDNTSITTSSRALFKGWMGTDKNMWTNFHYSSTQDFSSTTINHTIKPEYYDLNVPLADTFYVTTYGTWRIGQTFTTDPGYHYYLYNVSMKMFRQGSPGIETIVLYSANTSTGRPTGAVLASGTKDVSTVITDLNGEWVNITMSTYLLNTNTKYAIVAYGTGSSANFVAPRASGIAPTYPLGNCIRSDDGGTSYYNVSEADTLFRIYGHNSTTYGAGGIETASITTTSSDLFNILQGSLISGQMYYYLGTGNDTKGNITRGNTRYTLTNPEVPVFLNIIPSFTNSSVKITWIKGTGANRTVVMKSNAAYPSSVILAGTEYNDTGSLCWVHNISFNTTYYFSLFSFTSWGSLSRFSSGVHIPWGGVTFIVYNESKPWQVINGTMLVTDSLGLYPVQFTNCYGYHSFNISQIPYGENTIFYISNVSYESRQYPIDILPNIFYNFTFYLPPLHPPGWNTTPGNASAYYKIQIRDQKDLPVPDAVVQVYRYLNTTANYTYIGGFVTDGNGEGVIALFPFLLYMIKTNCEGYTEEINFWAPTLSDQTSTKIFKIYTVTETPETREYTEEITFNGYIDRTALVIHVNYTDALSDTINAQIIVYELDFHTNTTSVFGVNITIGDSDVYVSFPGADNLNTYTVVLQHNHSVFGYHRQSFIIGPRIVTITTPGYTNRLWDYNYGTNPFGWSNFLMWWVMAILLFYGGKEELPLVFIAIGVIFEFINVAIGFFTWAHVAAGVFIPIMFIISGVLVGWFRYRG